MSQPSAKVSPMSETSTSETSTSIQPQLIEDFDLDAWLKQLEGALLAKKAQLEIDIAGRVALSNKIAEGRAEIEKLERQLRASKPRQRKTPKATEKKA